MGTLLFGTLFLFICFKELPAFSFNHCDYGTLQVRLLCRGQPYIGTYRAELLDADFIIDETIDSTNGYLTDTSPPISLRAFISFDNCRDVSMYLRIISQCPRDLSFTNYGATFGLELVRRVVVPRLNFETCYDVTKDTSKWPITVELEEHPYCGLTEM